MTKADIYSISGKKTGTIELPEAWFGAKVNEALLAQAVRVYLSNQRSSNAKAKTRGEVLFTKKKMYRQKGTGRARHGSKSAPILVGGSKAHGPTGGQNYNLRLTTKMKRAALASALSMVAKENKIMVVDGLDKAGGKTKAAGKSVADWKLEGQKFTLVMPEKINEVFRAYRNLANSRVEQVDRLHAYGVLNAGKLVMMKEAIEKLRTTQEFRNSEVQNKGKTEKQENGKTEEPKIKKTKKSVLKKIDSVAKKAIVKEGTKSTKRKSTVKPKLMKASKNN